MRDLFYVFECDKLRITGRGTVTRSDLTNLIGDKTLCGCTSDGDFKTLEFESYQGEIVVEQSTDNLPTFINFPNLKTVNVYGRVKFLKHSFYNKVIENLKVNTDEVLTHGDQCLESTNLMNVVIHGNIISGCYVFNNCIKLKAIYYCGTLNPVFKQFEPWGTCKEVNCDIFGTTQCVVKVPYGSKVTKFGNKKVVYNGHILIKENMNNNSRMQIVYENNKLQVTGHGKINRSNSNSKVSEIIDQYIC